MLNRLEGARTYSSSMHRSTTLEGRILQARCSEGGTHDQNHELAARKLTWPSERGSLLLTCFELQNLEQLAAWRVDWPYISSSMLKEGVRRIPSDQHAQLSLPEVRFLRNLLRRRPDGELHRRRQHGPRPNETSSVFDASPGAREILFEEDLRACTPQYELLSGDQLVGINLDTTRCGCPDPARRDKSIVRRESNCQLSPSPGFIAVASTEGRQRT